MTEEKSQITSFSDKRADRLKDIQQISYSIKQPDQKSILDECLKKWKVLEDYEHVELSNVKPGMLIKFTQVGLKRLSAALMVTGFEYHSNGSIRIVVFKNKKLGIRCRVDAKKYYFFRYVRQSKDRKLLSHFIKDYIKRNNIKIYDDKD